jgi:hypothetical protein
MNLRILSILLILISTCDIHAQKKNKTIIPRDSITGQYAYNGKVTEIEGNQDALKQRLDKWIAQNYNFETDEHASLTVDEDEDTYSVHGREQMEGSARRFIEYDLTVDLRDNRYRYKLTDLRYIVVGNYALEDKRATDKKKDLEEIHRMMYNLLKSLQAAMTDTW